MKRLLFFIAFLSFAAFVSVLGFEVPSPDLIAVIVLTLVLVIYDFYDSTRGKND